MKWAENGGDQIGLPWGKAAGGHFGNIQVASQGSPNFGILAPFVTASRWHRQEVWGGKGVEVFNHVIQA